MTIGFLYNTAMYQRTLLVQLKIEFCGVEKWHLDWLITSKSEVRVLPTATKFCSVWHGAAEEVDLS